MAKTKNPSIHPEHKNYLINFYQQLAQDLLNKKISVKQFAQKLSQTHLELEDLADYDTLIPNFYNYRGFQKILHQTLQTLQTHQISGSLLILDVDQLKRFNDTFGHLAGNKLVQIYAEVIEKNTKKGDLKARLGGDEFTVFILGASLREALLVGERIRKEVIVAIKNSFPNLEWEQTISIGISESNSSSDEISLLQQADLALYQAKQDRNKTVIFSHPKI
ncbi:MAG: diguanylate cyclase [Candidatus Daviesbacteria bacterium]